MEKWTRVQLEELGTLGGRAKAEQNIPAMSPANRSQTVSDPTIQATLQQLSNLASGATAQKNKAIHLMDQNKPISHSENEELSGGKIKRESY